MWMKSPCFTDAINLYIEKTKEFTNKWIQHSCRINQYIKSIVFPYTSNKQSKNETQKTHPFTCPKRIKYSEGNLTEKVANLYIRY